MGRVCVYRCLEARKNIYSSYYVSKSFNSFSCPFMHSRGQRRSMYNPAEPTPGPLPLKANPENPVQVGSFDRETRPAINAPTKNAFLGITGNLQTKSKVEEAGVHVLHNKMMQTAKNTKNMEWRAMIKSGDVININDLLFTKNRDYLIRYIDNQRMI
ncbi:Scaffold protein Nfu/NifU N terminal [Orobanche minor]